MATSKIYSAPGLDLAHMAQVLTEWFQGKGYETQTLNTPAGLTLQARHTKQFFQRDSALGGIALNVALVLQGDNLQVQVGTGKWVFHAVGGVAAAIIFWPLLGLSAYQAYKQKEIMDQTWQIVEQYIATGGQVSAVGMGAAVAPTAASQATATAPKPAATPHPATKTPCPKCGQPTRAGARFCDNCGAKLDEPAVCAQCGAELRPGAKFCDNCGAKTPAAQEAAPTS